MKVVPTFYAIVSIMLTDNKLADLLEGTCEAHTWSCKVFRSPDEPNKH